MSEVWRAELTDREDGPVVDFGSGIVIPAQGTFTVRKADLPYDLDLAYQFDGDRFGLAAVTYRQRSGRDPVKSDLVRKVPLDRLLRDHLARHLPRSRSRILMRGTERMIAVYRAAFACHVPPTQAVATAFGMTQGAAEQKVFAARAEGLLPPTDQGKARG